MLCDLFAREQHQALDFLDGIVAETGKLSLKGKSQAGEGEFKRRERYRSLKEEVTAMVEQDLPFSWSTANMIMTAQNR